MSDNDWGYAIMSDGTKVPLQEPEALIPVERRRVVYKSQNLTMWVDKADDKK